MSSSGTSDGRLQQTFYDSRGQLSEIRDSTTSPTDTSWNRGAIINHYSNNCWGMCNGSNSTTSMTDNNGNLKKQEVYIPNDDQISGYDNYAQFYDYDSLNRLQSVRENKFGGQLTGNKPIPMIAMATAPSIKQTLGARAFQAELWRGHQHESLDAPSGYTMSYDSAGNLTFDDSDASEARAPTMLRIVMKQAWANSQWQTYTYDGDGHRVRRNVNESRRGRSMVLEAN